MKKRKYDHTIQNKTRGETLVLFVASCIKKIQIVIDSMIII